MNEKIKITYWVSVPKGTPVLEPVLGAMEVLCRELKLNGIDWRISGSTAEVERMIKLREENRKNRKY